MNSTASIENSVFYVGTRVAVCWDWHLREKNLDFLRGIDPAYYAHLVEAHAPFLDGDSKLQSSAALRVGYSQGLETLLALICAGMQAPDCVVGWMLTYRNSELREAVRGISSFPRLPVHPEFEPASWDTMSSYVHAYLPWGENKKAWITSGFSRLWSRFAREFLDQESTQEFNALKHGTRTRFGGFHLAIGIQPDKGKPAPPEAMHSLGGSEFGSSFFVEERLGESRLHFRPRRKSRNWDPINLANGLSLLAISIKNVVSFLRIINGDPPEECEFDAPLEEASFDAAWKNVLGVSVSSMDTILGVEDINLVSKEDALEILTRGQMGITKRDS